MYFSANYYDIHRKTKQQIVYYTCFLDGPKVTNDTRRQSQVGEKYKLASIWKLVFAQPQHQTQRYQVAYENTG